MIDRTTELRALAFGWLAAIGVGIAYGAAAEAFGLTWGLLVVGLFGGWVVGAAVSQAAWRGKQHESVRRLQAQAAGLAVVAGLIGLFVAYLISQVFLPEAATPLLERLSINGFTTYFGGLYDVVRYLHLAAIALMALMAWRGAR